MWINELWNNIDNIFELFGEDLYEAEDLLSSDAFNNLCESLQAGVEHALDGFVKWMDVWTHLPLSVCRLGGNHGPDFAHAFLRVFYSHPESDSPTLQEKSYTEFLQEDVTNHNQNTFGLLEALSNHDFFKQFDNFADSDGKEPWKFPLVYEFIKYRIYSIIVHQQQLEGLFNRYDIKVHPNMDTELQQARIQLSGLDGGIEKVTQEKLRHSRKEMKISNDNVESDNCLESSAERAQAILNTFLSMRQNR